MYFFLLLKLDLLYISTVNNTINILNIYGMKRAVCVFCVVQFKSSCISKYWGMLTIPKKVFYDTVLQINRLKWCSACSHVWILK